MGPESAFPVMTDAWLAESVERAKDLTVGQRTAIAAEINLDVARAKREHGAFPAVFTTGLARDTIAAMFRVRSRNIAYAAAIRRDNLELFKQLKLGEIEVHAAYAKIKHRIRAPRATPKLSAAPGDPRESTYWRNRAKRAYEVMVDVLSRTHGLCRVVDEDFELDLIRLKCTDKELATFVSMANWCAKTLRAFVAKTKENK